jgi:hypothetical protein
LRKQLDFLAVFSIARRYIYRDITFEENRQTKTCFPAHMDFPTVCVSGCGRVFPFRQYLGVAANLEESSQCRSLPFFLAAAWGSFLVAKEPKQDKPLSPADAIKQLTASGSGKT